MYKYNFYIYLCLCLNKIFCLDKIYKLYYTFYPDKIFYFVNKNEQDSVEC